ncbi:MAG: MarR family winged helix-turn-helix transcriptional regulator [Gemmatimonadaceae bacterium]
MARKPQRETHLDNSPLHLLHRVRQCAGELFQEEMAGIDLTARQYVVLVAAAQEDGLSQQDIIETTGIDRSTVSQVVQTMARKGLLKRRRTREDARAYAVTLTTHGRDVLKASEPIVCRIDEAIVAALSAARAAAFLDALRTIVGSMPTPGVWSATDADGDASRMPSGPNGGARSAAR